MQIPRSYIENYSNALNVVSERSRAALVDALSQIDYTADVADIRNAVIAIMQPACGASSTMAARLAADFYDGLRARFGIDDGFTADVDSQREPEATEGAVRAFAQDLVDEKPIEQFIGKCADRIDYETRRAANECIAYNAKNDPRKPRWARIPTGAETCQFCIMLASRGFVYHSEETASHAHSSCDCRVVPSWDKSPTAQGYDPDKYYDMWKHPEKYENAQGQDSGIEFSLGGIKNADVVRREINNLANEYHTPLLAVSEAPPAMINERMHEAGKAELYTGTAVWLKNGNLQTANHEFGHTIWSSKREDEYKQEGYDEFEKELKKLWRQYRKEQDLSKRISSYSTENIDEFFADGFAAYKTGKGLDKVGSGGNSPYALAIGELVDKYFKKR